MMFLIMLASAMVGFFVNQQHYGLAAFMFSGTVLAFVAGIYESVKKR